jgi:hypothetical protein
MKIGGIDIKSINHREIMNGTTRCMISGMAQDFRISAILIMILGGNASGT